MDKFECEYLIPDEFESGQIWRFWNLHIKIDHTY